LGSGGLEMKRFLVLAVLLASVMSGCGLVSSYQDRERRYAAITNYNLREIVDDWDYFWLYDRPSYLTYWNLRATGE
jgi:uncharacterized protein YceK